MKYFTLPQPSPEEGYCPPVNLAHVTSLEKSDPTGKYIIIFNGTSAQWVFLDEESRDINYEYLAGL